MVNNSTVPNYLQNVEAFKCGEQLALRLRSAGRKKAQCSNHMLDILNDKKASKLESILACEAVAESIGHPCWNHSWNIYLCEWIYRTRFAADDRLTKVAVRKVESLLRTSNMSAECFSDLENLLVRLRQNPINSARENPVLSKAAYKRIAFGFNHINEAFGVVQSILSIYNPTCLRVLEATALKPELVTEISVAFDGEPSIEDREAVAILLHRFRDTIHDLRCDAQHGRKSEQTELTREFWHKLLPQVKELSKLEWLESTYLPIAEADALAFLSLPALKGFRSAALNSKFRVDIDYTERFVRAICEKENVLIVDVPSLSDELVGFLRTAASRPSFQVNGRLVVDRSRATFPQ